MVLEVHLTIQNDLASTANATKLDQILTLLTALVAQEKQTQMTVEQLGAQVRENTDVEASAIKTLDSLAAMIAANKTDPAALQALADSLKQSSTALAADIAANTQAA